MACVSNSHIKAQPHHACRQCHSPDSRVLRTRSPGARSSYWRPVFADDTPRFPESIILSCHVQVTSLQTSSSVSADPDQLHMSSRGNSSRSIYLKACFGPIKCESFASRTSTGMPWQVCKTHGHRRLNRSSLTHIFITHSAKHLPPNLRTCFGQAGDLAGVVMRGLGCKFSAACTAVSGVGAAGAVPRGKRPSTSFIE